MPPAAPPTTSTPASVRVQATYGQKAVPFITEGNVEAVVLGGPGKAAGELDARGAGRGERGGGRAGPPSVPDG